MSLPRVLLLVLAAFGILGLPQARAQDADRIDWDKARQLRQRVLRGEELTAEERAYLERVREARRQGPGRPGAAAGKRPAGLKPLTDMTAGERYRGEEGGLYGGGRNGPPKGHLKAALRQAQLIRPLDADGEPAKDGKVVFLSVGLSNTTQALSPFLNRANGDPDKSPNVVIVDGAPGGMEAQAWAEPKPWRDPWAALDRRLKRAGVTPRQVQVAWIKQARRNPAPPGEFPGHGREMKGHMVVGLQKLKERFPNLRIAYLSSRTYGGYATTPRDHEPYAYETAFVVRWLIQGQVKGDPALQYDPDKGAVKAPFLLWGPYLWANGEKGREVDDLAYRREDFVGDGTRPSMKGRQKVAEQLLRFLKNDPTAKVVHEAVTRQGVRFFDKLPHKEVKDGSAWDVPR